MGHWVSAHLNFYFAHYGYWTILVGLLLESAGVPLPGETILILATFQASTRHHMNVLYVAVVAIVAATMGDNLGYLLGCKGAVRCSIDTGTSFASKSPRFAVAKT